MERSKVIAALAALCIPLCLFLGCILKDEWIKAAATAFAVLSALSLVADLFL